MTFFILPDSNLVQAQEIKCKDGECIEGLINRLEDLSSVYGQECLPQEGEKVSLQEYYDKNGLSEKCWRLITEINHLEKELSKHQTELEERLNCQNGDCTGHPPEVRLNSQISVLTKVEQNLSCTEPKKEIIKKQCPDDLECILFSAVLDNKRYLAETFIPEKYKPKNCNLVNDDCSTQLASSFLNTVLGFFEVPLDYVKTKMDSKMTVFWNWMSGIESHASTSQLALAKASEDPGVFKMLVNDFSGTMKNIWAGFVESLKYWFKNDILCEKWAGAPHFSKCTTPNESVDCISCKAMVNGLCALGGGVVAEVVPSFLTGGLVTAAKYGAKSAVSIAKSYKISKTTLTALKNSHIAKMTNKATNKIDDVLKLSKTSKSSKILVRSSIKNINRYLLSPTRKAIKKSFEFLSHEVKKGSVYLLETKLGKKLVFDIKAAKMVGKVALYPIINPLSTFAYRAGQRSFEHAFKLGTPVRFVP